MSRRFGRNRCFWFLKVGVLEADFSWFPRNFGAIYQTERCHIPEPHKWVRCRDIVVISDDRPVTNRTFERNDLAAYFIYGVRFSTRRLRHFHFRTCFWDQLASFHVRTGPQITNACGVMPPRPHTSWWLVAYPVKSIGYYVFCAHFRTNSGHYT
jgi:hypothetical protein